MPLLSVIVPVYKTEKYLSACIDSLLAQTISDMEIILVDDGSPDNSGAICDDYATQYPNITVIHKKNEGQTLTRKAGLQRATGQYIAFADSDDWLDPDMYQSMLDLAQSNQADVVAVGFTRDFGEHTEIYRNPIPSGVYENSALDDLRNHALFHLPTLSDGIAPSLWSKIFRREIALECMMPRQDTIRLGEDLLCTHAILTKARCVVIDNDNHAYHYRIWDGSISNIYRANYFEDLFTFYDSLSDIYQSNMTPSFTSSLSYYYILRFIDGVYMEISRKNPAGWIQKYLSLRALNADPRFTFCASHIHISDLPKSIQKDMQLLLNHAYGRFILRYILQAGLSRVKNIFKK